MYDPHIHVNDARLLLEAARELAEFAEDQRRHLMRRRRRRGAPWPAAAWEASEHASDLRAAVRRAA